MANASSRQPDRYPLVANCPKCHGLGEEENHKCPNCKGTGKVVK